MKNEKEKVNKDLGPPTYGPNAGPSSMPAATAHGGQGSLCEARVTWVTIVAHAEHSPGSRALSSAGMHSPLFHGGDTLLVTVIPLVLVTWCWVEISGRHLEAQALQAAKCDDHLAQRTSLSLCPWRESHRGINWGEADARWLWELMNSLKRWLW